MFALQPEVAPAEVRFEDSGKVQESASTSSQQQGDVLHSLIQSSQQKSETSNKLKRLVEQAGCAADPGLVEFYP